MNTQKKKKHFWKIAVFLLILILAAAAACGWYYMQLQKPQAAIKEFLGYMQQVNLDGMSSLLQSNDLSALDDADITEPAYSEFFRNINAKMSYELTNTRFSIQNGTANIFVHIRYIDGTNIYKETVAEFLRQIVASAFSGESGENGEADQVLASILEEKSRTVPDQFAEADIIYSLIDTVDGWKIVSLDDETVRIMSANFKSVRDEIEQSLLNMEQESSSQTPAAPTAEAGSSIDMDTSRFSIRYTQHRIGTDLTGGSCLLLYYDYTNNGTEVSSAMVDVHMQVYQNGALCETAIPEENEDAMNNYMADIQPGQTVNVCQAFALSDLSDVTVQAGEAFSLGGGELSTQTLQLQ